MENDLLFFKNTIVRVVEVDSMDGLLVIDCLRKSMPFWVGESILVGASRCEETELLKRAAPDLPKFEDITEARRKTARQRYALISPIVPLSGSKEERSRMISYISNRQGISKATIRSWLCAYLAFMNLSILAPLERKPRPLSQNEKNFRWALNKFYFTSLKLSLKAAFRRMLKDKYCDSAGILVAEAPSFRQFQYFFLKTVKQQNLIISRDGRGDYMRNHRPLLGEGIRSFCPSAGYGMFDSTVCDIFLVNDEGELIGRPILAACVDAYSSMCLGYSLGLTGGVESLERLALNLVEDKTDWCRKFGINIKEEEWNCRSLPHVFITDLGREYASQQFSQLSDLGVSIVNLPPYRPELKGAVEKFFDLIQASFKKELATKGVIFEDYQERGGVDYRKKATFTIDEFEKILLLCIVNYNTKRAIDLPPEAVGKVKPFANELWSWSLRNHKDNVIDVTKIEIQMSLLPRTKGIFKRDGLYVNRLRYRNGSFTERFLKGGNCVVAYDPANVGVVYLFEEGNYIPFQLIERFFDGKTISFVKEFYAMKAKDQREAQTLETQGAINLTRELDLISKSKPNIHTEVKHAKENRTIEIKKEGK